MYYCIGDSHTWIFGSDPETFEVNHIGPYTAYNFSKGHESYAKTDSIISGLPKNSSIILSFGEIDCRCHILKQKYEKNRDVSEIIEDIIVRYLSSITTFQRANYTLILLAPSPTGNFNNDYSFNHEYPFYGTYKERNEITKIFIHSLKQKYPKVISIYDYIINSDGSSNMEYFKDTIHLSDKAFPYIKKELNKIL